MKSAEVICETCWITFYKNPSKVKPINYCSWECVKGARKHKSALCENCGKIVSRPESQMLDHVFCSRICAKGYLSLKFADLGRNHRTEVHVAEHPLYQTWNGMKTRCYAITNRAYKNYGGRGIRVCERWLNSFEDFVKDMGLRPPGKYSIDRINNDGNYSPENCRWATITQQNRNKRAGGRRKVIHA